MKRAEIQINPKYETTKQIIKALSRQFLIERILSLIAIFTYLLIFLHDILLYTDVLHNMFTISAIFFIGFFFINVICIIYFYFLAKRYQRTIFDNESKSFTFMVIFIILLTFISLAGQFLYVTLWILLM